MTNLLTPTRKSISLEDLFRTTLNKILEDEVKSGVKLSQPLATITIPETIDISHTEPTITTTTSATNVYDDATATYESSEYT